MPVTHTNCKGVAYTLYRKTGKDGRLSYYFGRRPSGEPVDELPPGYRISESPNGRVSLAKDQPMLILPEEIAVVEAEVARHPDASSLRLSIKPKRIEIYGKVTGDPLAVYRDLVAAGLFAPGHEATMQQIDRQVARFEPLLAFALLDPERRVFGAEQFFADEATKVWEDLDMRADLAALASAVLPALTRDAPDLVTVVPERERAAPPPRKRRRAQPASIHRLRITLLGVQPAIWRRVEVASDISLAELHGIVQSVMGWDNGHLHEFRAGGVSYTNPRQMPDLGDRDERAARLDVVAPRTKRRLRYTYDFGDNWEHEILVEAITAPEPEKRYPVCLAGMRAGPPEDCGGVWGYANLLEAIADPENPEHEWLLEWLGGPFDPEAFDVAEVNRQLARLR